MMLVPGVLVPLLWTIALDVLSSIFSELRSRIFHSRSVLMVQIPCVQCIQYQTFATFSVVVLVEGRQERSSSSTNIRPFLKLLNHS